MTTIYLEIQVELDHDDDGLSRVLLASPGRDDLDITGYLNVDEFQQAEYQLEGLLEQAAIRKAEMRDVRGDEMREMRREIQREELASRESQRGAR